jgi:heterotetrameric sarcosine oxidase delta subunit
MLLLPCPWCGPRNDSEFRYVGEARPRPDPAHTSIQDWRAYLYDRANPCGWVTEHWFHRSGCRRFVTFERHTLTHEIRSGDARSITFGRPGGTSPGAQNSWHADEPGERDRTEPWNGDRGGA